LRSGKCDHLCPFQSRKEVAENNRRDNFKNRRPLCPQRGRSFVVLVESIQQQIKKEIRIMSTMTQEQTKSAVKPIPEGMHTVTPHLICAGAIQAIEFYKKAFGAVELSRLPGPEGKLMHGSIRIGDSTIMLMDEMPQHGAFGAKSLKGSPVTIHLYVEDADAVFAQAVKAGAKVTMALEDMFWGDRYGVVEDPFGHKWSIGTHIRDVTPEEMQEAMKQMSC
jgi:uncharacterized glyoxalase superfamily protein PhnB